MATGNGFADMTLAELRDVRTTVDALIVEKTAAERSRVRAAIIALAHEHNFEIADLLTKRRPRTTVAPAVRFRNPRNPTQTWSGRGRRPNWMGKRNPQEFRVS